MDNNNNAGKNFVLLLLGLGMLGVGLVDRKSVV